MKLGSKNNLLANWKWIYRSNESWLFKECTINHYSLDAVIKTLLHVWCLFVDDRYVIYLVSVDADIDDKQVAYFGLKNFLERMTNHLKIPYILSGNIPELLENSGFLLKYLCLVKRTLWKVWGGSGRFKMVLEKLILVYDIILIPGIYQNIPK